MTLVLAAVLGAIVAIGAMQLRTVLPGLLAVRRGDAGLAAPSEARPSGRRVKAPVVALAGAGAIALAVVAWTTLRASDTASPHAPVGTAAGSLAPAAGASGLADVDTMISRLEARLKTNPQDAEGFRMLGWSHTMTGHPERALEPFRQALALAPARADIHEGFGEALAGVAGGAVTPEAHEQFSKAIALDPKDARARFFLGKWQAQNGKEREALDAWIALANEGPPDANWQGEVRNEIDRVAQKLGVDTGKRLKTAPAAQKTVQAETGGTLATPAAAQMTMTPEMVDSQLAEVRADPHNPDGWIALMQAHLATGERNKAIGDVVSARLSLASDRVAVERINAAARQAGLSGWP